MASVAHKAKEKKLKRLKNIQQYRDKSNFSISKHQNRCQKCGRSRAYIRRFKLCRICFRELAMKGELPGVKKASW